MRHPRFELVTTDAGHHFRFRASNGRILFASETYTRRRTAVAAIQTLARCFDADVTQAGVRSLSYRDHRPVEVREVDERGAR